MHALPVARPRSPGPWGPPHCGFSAAPPYTPLAPHPAAPDRNAAGRRRSVGLCPIRLCTVHACACRASTLCQAPPPAPARPGRQRSSTLVLRPHLPPAAPARAGRASPPPPQHYPPPPPLVPRGPNPLPTSHAAGPATRRVPPAKGISRHLSLPPVSDIHPPHPRTAPPGWCASLVGTPPSPPPHTHPTAPDMQRASRVLWRAAASCRPASARLQLPQRIFVPSRHKPIVMGDARSHNPQRGVHAAANPGRLFSPHGVISGPLKALARLGPALLAPHARGASLHRCWRLAKGGRSRGSNPQQRMCTHTPLLPRVYHSLEAASAPKRR